ncbi:MAG: GGDEF domain-containing protein [Cellulosilyticaceae bacterium]
MLEETKNRYLRTGYCVAKWLFICMIFLSLGNVYEDVVIFERVLMALLGISSWNGCIYYISKKAEDSSKVLKVLSILEIMGDSLTITILAWCYGGYSEGFEGIFFMVLMVFIWLNYGATLISYVLILFIWGNLFVSYENIYQSINVLYTHKLWILMIIGVWISFVFYTISKEKSDFRMEMQCLKEQKETLETRLQQAMTLRELGCAIYKSESIERAISQSIGYIHKLIKSDGIGIILYGENNVESDARCYTYLELKKHKMSDEQDIGYQPFYGQVQLQNIRNHRAYKNCILSHEPISIQKNEDEIIANILPGTKEKYLYLFNIIREGKECGMIVCNTPMRLDVSASKQIDEMIQYVALTLDKINQVENEKEKSMKDTLTHVASRRAVEEILKKHRIKARKEQKEIGILFVDIDHFKQFNDTYGHPVGDLVLKQVAQCMQKHMPHGGTVGRYGGEEFVAILYGETEEKSYRIAEKIREEIANHSLEAYTQKHTVLTVSIGVATYQGDMTGIDEVVNRADKAMYQAKKEKNKVCIYNL